MVEAGYDVAPTTSPSVVNDPAASFRAARVMQEQMRRRRN